MSFSHEIEVRRAAYPNLTDLHWATAHYLMKIHLVGPGGAGKTTVGAFLKDRLNTPFVDLDMVFRERAGDISDYMQRRGYRAVYAGLQLDVYRSIAAEAWVWRCHRDS